MVICQEYNKETCNPKCPHSVPHEPIYDIYLVAEGEYMTEGYCNESASACGFDSEWPMVRCGEKMEAEK